MYKGSHPTNYSSSQKTKLNALSYDIKICTNLSSVLLQSTRLTDGRTDTEFSSLDRVCIACSAVKIQPFEIADRQPVCDRHRAASLQTLVQEVHISQTGVTLTHCSAANNARSNFYLFAIQYEHTGLILAAIACNVSLALSFSGTFHQQLIRFKQR